MNENRFIWSASLLSLILHLVLAGIIWRTPPISVDTSLAEAAEVEMILIAEDDPNPERFVLIPERVANKQEPDKGGDPIAASLFDSRAADGLTGGDESTPSASELSDLEKVEIKEDQPNGAEGVEVENISAMAPKQSSGADSGEETGEGNDSSSENRDSSAQWALPSEESEKGTESQEENKEEAEEAPEMEDWWGDNSPSLLKEGEEGEAGDRGFDFSQKESGSQGAGVAYVGNYSMNTYEWNFSPWMKKWVNQLHRHWKAPYAYTHLGIINGATVIRMVIRKDGRVESFEVLETDGHASLHEASEAAVKAFAPYSPLPADFPEPYLVLTMELRYPALR